MYPVSPPRLHTVTTDALQERIEELEARLMHQEAAIDELTRTLLHQEQMLSTQAQALKRLTAQLRALADPHTLSSSEEGLPPHY